MQREQQPGLDLAPFLQAFPEMGLFRFELVAADPIELPPYAGSAWRGLLGRGLRRTVCVTRQPVCEGCLLRETCVYSRLFETPPDFARAPGPGNAVPHPYVIVIDPAQPRPVEPGERLTVGLCLIGAANSSVPYLVHAVELAGDRGIGRRHGRFELGRVCQWTGSSGGWQATYDGQGTLRPLPGLRAAALATGAPPLEALLRLLTPLRMKRRGNLVGPREFQITEWVRQLVWRLNDLSREYGGSQATLDLATLAPLAETLRVERQSLRWRDWTRYSSRQDTLMQLGGLVGEIRIGGASLFDLWPLLRLGQWLHVGKATSMGLGRFELLDTASLPERRRENAETKISEVGGTR